MLLAALALRLVIMPFFANGDLGADMWRAYELVYRGQNHTTDMAWVRTGVGAVGIRLAALGTPDLDELMPAHGISIAYFGYSLPRYWPAWAKLASQPRFMLAQFLFKCVYLPFDLLIAFLIARLCRDRERLAVRAWLFNPVALFATYMWGRLDVVMLAFLMAAMTLIAGRRLILGLACVLLAALTKAAAVILLPVLAAVALASQRRWRGPLVAASGLAFVALCWWPPFRQTLGAFSRHGHTQYLIETRFSTHHLVFPELIAHQIYLLPAFLLIVAFSVYQKHRERLVPALALSYLGYFALCHFHPHYLVWVVPFLIVVSIRNSQLLQLIRLQGIVFLVLFLGLKGVNLFLPGLPTLHGDGNMTAARIWHGAYVRVHGALPEVDGLLLTALFAIHVLFIAKIWWSHMRDPDVERLPS
ncbi:MAG: hypothetical protein DRQ55_11670 [Planctomycetota bacterium]|nr:MAG: hypothetical protein DRQ55_11670 [Planctomycetota bacterium]